MFEVGKKVIAIHTALHPSGKGIKRGEVYPLNAIIKACCGESLAFDVGIALEHSSGGCSMCGKRYPTGILWISSQYFAPYDDSLSETTVEELLYQLTA
jgi:hypothetical protein